MCYRSHNVNTLLKLGLEKKYIASIKNVVIKSESDRLLILNTILQYCSENISIRLENSANVFCDIIFKHITEHIGKLDSKNK
jgi:hypothetical protein